jgi:hypothetical protein
MQGPDRRGREPSALVRLASPVTEMVPIGSVIDRLFPRPAQLSAPAKPGLQALDRRCVRAR